MLMTKQTEVLIISFIAICIFMILFEIAHAFLMKQRDKKLKELIDNDNTINDLLSNPKKLTNETNLLAFELCFDKEKENNEPEFKNNLPKAQEIFADLVVSEKYKDNIVKSYVVYLCTKYKLFYKSTDENIKKELICMVGSQNIYVRENALKCIYSIGETSLVNEALLALQNNDINHNRKLLHDGLLDFAGNKEELADLLLKNFNNFNLEMQIMLFTYFRYQTGKYTEFALNCLTDPSLDKELHFAALRYLQKYPYEKALPVIIKIAKEEKDVWEYRAICAFCLGSYNTHDSIETLKQMISDPMWHVRKNAAESLIKLKVDKKEIDEILQGDDKFAKEQMQYKLDVEMMKTEVEA